MNPVLSVERLSKAYGRHPAVDQIDLALHKGEILGLIGPNGAGKTTTLECILGLRQPDQGKVTIAGIDALKSPDRCRSKVGAVLQACKLPDKITPQEALQLFATFYPRSQSAQTTLEQFGLLPQAAAPYHTLSGGQKQRLALALAFIHQPELFILDEPTAGLDPTVRRELMTLIRQCRDTGAAVLISTHLLDEAARECDQIAVIDTGKIVVQGTLPELLQPVRNHKRITFTTDRPLNDTILTSLPCIHQNTTHDHFYTLQTDCITTGLRELTGRLAQEQIELKSLSSVDGDLEAVYFQHTGKGYPAEGDPHT